MPPEPISASVLLLRFAGSIRTEIRRVVEENQSLNSKVKNALDALQTEVKVSAPIVAAKEESCPEAMLEARILLMQEVLLDIEDFLLGLWAPGKYGIAYLFVGLDKRSEQVDRINHFRDVLKGLQDSKPEPGAYAAPTACPDPRIVYQPESELVGIADRKSELLRLMSPKAGEVRNKVIALVGHRGVGKTALARVLHDHCQASRSYGLVGWIVASGCSNADVLMDKIAQAVRAAAEENDRYGFFLRRTRYGDIHSILHNKRYMLVLDDVEDAHLWLSVKEMLPENGLCSSIIVTTNRKSTASSCRGHIYTVHGLSSADSQKLFWQKVQVDPSPALKNAAKGIFLKCNGSPLALISVANHLLEQGKVNLTVRDCEREGLDLGKNLAGSKAAASFQEIRRLLAKCYSDLPDHVHRLCLLSVIMSPKGHRIKTKNLIREMVAGGLIGGGGPNLRKEKYFHFCLEELINRCILDEVIVSLDYEVKRCEMDGIMLEFVIHKSISRNFATLINEDDFVPNSDSPGNVRRLSIHGGTEYSRKLIEKVELSHVRWLRISSTTIFMGLKACKLLRVLVLEGCQGVDEMVMESIYGLQFLKYLSLRDTDVNMVSKKIKKLKYLETLDTRGTGVRKLPIEVFKLPYLACLFGQFQLPYSSKEASATFDYLHTLSGAMVGTDWQGFDQIMRRTGKQLKKLKIWCDIPQPFASPLFQDRLQERINETGSCNLDCLTIVSSDLCNQFVNFLEPPCGVRTIKLRGTLDRLPFPAILRQLTSVLEVHLVSSGLTCSVLSILQTLPCLIYLKLSEPDGFVGGSSFVAQSDGFPSLERLRFEAPVLPMVVIEPGAMKRLSCLDLLCKEYSAKTPPSPSLAESIEYWGGIHGFSYLGCLNEVIVHTNIGESLLQKWMNVATPHKCRPNVKINDS